MLGTVVSGRSIIVLRCCHHPACGGQSPRHKPRKVQENDGAAPHRETPSGCERKGRDTRLKWMNEFKLHMAAEDTTTRCSTGTNNAPTVFFPGNRHGPNADTSGWQFQNKTKWFLINLNKKYLRKHIELLLTIMIVTLLLLLLNIILIKLYFYCTFHAHIT